MKKNKIILAAVVLLGVFVIGGAIALFTDTETKTNTFTVGNVDISVVETAWDNLPDADTNGKKDAAENLMPGQEVTKDPKVKNDSTTSKAYVYLKVESPCTTDTPAVELFPITPKTGWTLMTDGSCTSGKVTRIYNYGTASAMTELAAGASTGTLFDSVTLANIDGNAHLPSNTDIVVTGYGVQTTGLTATSPSGIWAEANFS